MECITTSYKIKCVELTQRKQQVLSEYIQEYARIYNIVGKLLPSLPKKYIKESNPSGLYTRWVKKGSKELLKSEILSSQMIMSAMSDAITNFKVSGRINQIENPNIIKFQNSEYEVIKLHSSNPNRNAEERYAINIIPMDMIIPIIEGRKAWGVSDHLNKGISMHAAKKIRNKELVQQRKEQKITGNVKRAEKGERASSL